MKKLLPISIITACFLFMGVSGVSASPVAGKAANPGSKGNVRNQIISNITCPGFVKENSAANDVKAIVQVDGKGKVSVTDINSANPRLLEYVTAQLESMTIKNVVGPERFLFIIHFKVQ